MGKLIGHASEDEKGNGSGGDAGDQTGKEVCVREWYDGSWHTMLRPIDINVGYKIAEVCRAACNNDMIGYNKDKRLSLYKEAVKVGFDLARIDTPCDCDCSSLVAVCVIAAGVNVSPSITTGDMVTALMNTGQFEKHQEAHFLKSDEYLKPGDILVKSGHTVMALEYGDKVEDESHKSGWVQEDGGWRFYLGDTGQYVKDNWYKDGDNWYWFNGAGLMIYDTWYQYEEKWYFFKENGAMAREQWVIWNDKLYRITADGSMFEGDMELQTDLQGALEEVSTSNSPKIRYVENLSTPVCYNTIKDEIKMMTLINEEVIGL